MESTTGPETQLRGRRAEYGVLNRLISSARAATSEVLVLRGEAGAGKTALLDHLSAHAPGCQVVRAAGRVPQRAVRGEFGTQPQARRTDRSGRAGARSADARREAIVRTLVGPGSPLELGTPALILDVELGNGIAFSQPIPAEFNAFVWMLQGKTGMGSNRRRAAQSQIVVLGPGAALTVAVGTRRVRFMLMSGKPHGEQPTFNGPYAD